MLLARMPASLIRSELKNPGLPSEAVALGPRREGG